MLRVSEVYQSVQGEGPQTGNPTTFVRFGGCNFRCPGWPCDTLYAVEPKYRADWEKVSAVDLAERVSSYPTNVCITGGEPFMQDKVALQHFTELLWQLGHSVEFFTNGSFPFPDWIWTYGDRVMLDWKLLGSGEATHNIDVRLDNYRKLAYRDGVKFVVTGMGDLIGAKSVFDGLIEDDLRRRQRLHPDFWVGKAWGHEITDEDIVGFILAHQLPWRLNVQVHKTIWAPDEKGV